MAALKLKVTYADGRAVDVRVSPKAQVEFERHFKIGLPQAGQDMHNEYLFYLGWAALHTSGQESQDFDTFLDLIDEVTPLGAEPVDPTPPDRPADSSSS